MSSGNKQLFPDLLLSASNLFLCRRSLNISFFMPFFLVLFVTAILLYAISLLFSQVATQVLLFYLKGNISRFFMTLYDSSLDPHCNWLFLCKYRILNLSLMNLSSVFHTVSSIYQDHSGFLSCLPMCLQFLPVWCIQKYNN